MMYRISPMLYLYNTLIADLYRGFYFYHRLYLDKHLVLESISCLICGTFSMLKVCNPFSEISCIHILVRILRIKQLTKICPNNKNPLLL